MLPVSPVVCYIKYLYILTNLQSLDFCLWAPPEPGRDVGDIEGEMVAYCSTRGHGTRLIPAGAITGLQYLRTPDYIQIVGFIDQTVINMKPDDYGGEMDPHGADLRGNPMGGVLFSDVFSGSPGVYRQVPDWHKYASTSFLLIPLVDIDTSFIGGGAFCFKACDPARENRTHHCEHIYDRIGCVYNDPNNARDGVFEACLADSADWPGVYTAANGSVMTYTQPEGPITTVTYTPRIPASSSCVSLTSSVVFAGLPTATGSSVRSSTSGLSSTRRTGSSTGAVPTPTAGSSTSDGMVIAISGVSILGVVFSALFLA